ncbi:MAG: Ig-like domain-containing protein [Polyangiales bacterium]
MNRALSPRPEFRALVGRLVLALGALGAVVGAVVGYQLSAARAAIDVRVQGPIVEGVDGVRYVVRVSPCRDVTTIAVGTASETREVRSVSEAVAVGDACELEFEGTGAARLQPYVVVTYADGSTESHTESLGFERNAPSLELEGVRITNVGGVQHLVVSTQAFDDTDLAYVAISAVGLRASALRDAGGVIERAREQSFADTGGFERVVPREPGQRAFELAVPIADPLSAREIAANGLVLVEAMAVDASGNQRSVSELLFTGGDVRETARSMSVVPERVILTNLLDSIVLVPSVDFEFRGPTPMPGSGTGVTFQSSHPEIVAVTPAGLVYPLQPTADDEVSIRVSYPGVSTVVVPVEVDPTKSLTGLRVEGTDSEGRLVLPSLNASHPLPRVWGVFSDGSEAEVGRQLRLAWSSADESALEVTTDGLVARRVIGEDATVALTVGFHGGPTAIAVVPVVARDAIPEVSLGLPSFVRAGEALTIRPSVSDDVAIRSVRFFVDDDLVGERTSAPYEVRLDVPETATGEIAVRVVATDSAGQESAPAEGVVRVVDEGTVDVPVVEIETPFPMARYVEGSPIRFSASVEVGVRPTRSAIAYVDFTIDGRVVAQASFPTFEEREGAYYEVWRAETIAEEISTASTSRVAQAIAHSGAGEPSHSIERIFLIVENQSPLVSIVAPATGGTATVGSSLTVDVEVADDTLNAGLDIELLADGRVVGRHFHRDRDDASTNTIVLARARHSFVVPIPSERLGSTMRLRARVTDIRGVVAQSNEVALLARGDQRPTVAVAHPVAGSTHVGGTVLELRANAVDDIRIERVDFFVDGLLVGADASPPFSFFHPTAPVRAAQPMTVHAVALDSGGHTTRSADVVLTLGPDTQRPVVNFASPTVTRTEAGRDYAEVVERTDVVLRISGLDNVGVERLVVRGVGATATGLSVTGDLADEIDLRPETIPGALRAFTATRILSIPASGRASDVYPVAVVARDAAGNESLAELALDVRGDRAPTLGVVRTDRDAYFPRDTAALAVQALDDVGVGRLDVEYWVGGSRRGTDSFVAVPPARNLQHVFDVELGALGLANEDASVEARITARDTNDVSSEPTVAALNVRRDAAAPLVTILEPRPGTTLYPGERVTGRWRGADDSGIARVQITLATGSDSLDVAPNTRTAEGGFSFVVTPDVVEGRPTDHMTLRVRGRDVFGQERTHEERFPIGSDAAPEVRIVGPPPGIRLVEGEPFTLTAVATDDRELRGVRFFVETADGTTLETYGLTNEELRAGLASGGRFARAMRVPTRPEGESLRIGVEATDGSRTTRGLAEITVVDDLEPPAVRIVEPADPTRARLGQELALVVAADDDVFVESLEAFLVRDGEQVALPWGRIERRDRVEEIRRPNPSSFGSELVATRFHTEARAVVRIPTDGVLEGQTYALTVQARDRGVHTTESAPLDLEIVGDREAPVVRFLEPPAAVFERQRVNGNLEVTDDVEVRTVSVRVQGGPVLASLTPRTRNAFVPFELDVPAYAPDERITLVAEAEDASGNVRREVRVLAVVADAAPRVRVAAPVPEMSVLRGGLAFHTLELSDDFVASSAPLTAFSALTSFDDWSTRAVQGCVHVDVDRDETLPCLALDYPEASAAYELRVGGRPYVQTGADGTLRMMPGVHTRGDLELVTPEGQTVEYRVRADRACETCECTSMPAWEVSPAPPSLTALAASGARFVDVELVVRSGGAEVEAPIRFVRVHLDDLRRVSTYEYAGGSSHVRTPDLLAWVILRRGATGRAAIAAYPETRITSGLGVRAGHAFPVLPSELLGEMPELSVLAHAVDRFSAERPAPVLESAVPRLVEADLVAPTVRIASPANGSSVVPGQRLEVRVDASDASSGIRSIRLLDGEDRLLARTALGYREAGANLVYEIPGDRVGGRQVLRAVATDYAGRSSSHEVALPIQPNAPPELRFVRFAAERAGGDYEQVELSPTRLNRGEFWVRQGAEVALRYRASDDAAVHRLELWRLDTLGARVGAPVVERSLETTCPNPQVRSDFFDAVFTFDRVATTEYEVVAYDQLGVAQSRRVLLHPRENVAPELRITTPADRQLIAAGTFRILVGVVATDDRSLDLQRNLEVYANGTRLVRGAILDGDDPAHPIANTVALEAARAEIYDALEAKYSATVAAQLSDPAHPHQRLVAYAFELPPGLVRGGESIDLVAVLRDGEGALGRDIVSIVSAPDDIRPEVAILDPQPGFGPHENGDFALRFQAYDNVKVAALEVRSTFGVRGVDGSYSRLPYGAPLRRIDAIEPADFDLRTPINIDTPEYVQRVVVPRIAELASLWPGLVVEDGVRFDVWTQVVARDEAGNVREREISFPVRVDERPVVDVVAPLPGARVVEGSSLNVNVHAFDDVGIDSLRLVVTHGTGGREIANLSLRSAPWQFGVDVPAFDEANPTENLLVLSVEAIDRYGASTGDLDRHVAYETVTVEIIRDEPPTVVVGAPLDGTRITEGESLLVQVNAIDDVGIERVAVHVAGLVGGDRVLVDPTFPFEVLVPVPYGQAGRDLRITATATEQTNLGDGRTRETPSAVRVFVDRDEEAPTVRVIEPADSGATAVEGRELRFSAEIFDDVRVSLVEARLFVDRHGDGTFDGVGVDETTADDDMVATRLMREAPYFGTFRVQSIADYLALDPGPEALPSLPMLIEIRARDGAGNVSSVQRPVLLRRNEPPQVEQIQVLDSRGFNLGAGATELTEGREIVLNVVARDLEVGVDSARLFVALGDEAPVEAFSLVGEDVTAPFQFAYRIPAGTAGTSLRFWADAMDLDGLRSARSAERRFVLRADAPPTARIVRPRADETVVIEGMDVVVDVEARDDLGADGIDRVVFFVDGVASFTAYDPVSVTDELVGLDDVYRATFHPPDGVAGFEVYAVAYDQLGQAGQSQTILVGTIEDTVAPDVDVLSPADGDILTAGETVPLRVAVTDVGVLEDRHVLVSMQRVTRTGEVRASVEDVELTLDGTASDPENDYYVYTAAIADSALLSRGVAVGERLEVRTVCVTPNHTVESRSTNEVGLPVAERVYPATSATDTGLAQSAYVSAAAQFVSDERENALIGAWTTQDPMRLEPGLGLAAFATNPPLTGVYLSEPDAAMPSEDGDGTSYVFDGSAINDVFRGSITELHADASFVLAAKSGRLPGIVTGADEGGFGLAMARLAESSESADVHLDDDGGELLVFTVQSGVSLGIPYLLEGRTSLPYPEVHGLARKDDVVLVANGHGGVQVVDISTLSAPYRVGYIKPNGYARDVAIRGSFAFIAASQEGLVVADLEDPTMPIVTVVDTAGVATRVAVDGRRVYVTNMSGEGFASELTVFDVSDPYRPALERVIDLRSARRDYVADGVYDVAVSGGKAFVTVHSSDQEDVPAQSHLEIVDLARLDDPLVDPTIPAVIHRTPTVDDVAARGVLLARGAIHVAGGRRGLARVEHPALSVVSHVPASDADGVSTELSEIRIELSAEVAPGIEPDNETGATLTDFVHVRALDPMLGEDLTSSFSVGFGEGDAARRFLVLRRGANVLDPGTPVFVTVSAGLLPLTGLALPADYTFRFDTSRAGAAMGPRVVRVEPALGSVSGGTDLRVCGHAFEGETELFVGGQRHAIGEVVETGDPECPHAVLTTTLPNAAGPAAVEVRTTAGRDVRLGAFVYTDSLQISYVSPAVVRVSQAGEGDRVEVVGYGFRPGLRLRAWPSGRPAEYVEDVVGDGRLRLLSGERMSWVVPDFGADFRGFVDVEAWFEDERFLQPSALFYGRLGIQSSIERHEPADVSGPTWVPDARRLPPGRVFDVASDTERRLLYVLGQPVGSRSQHTVAGWLSLVRYDRDALEDAAPMHGLGYYNTPLELIPFTVELGERHVYVSAQGADLVDVDSEMEGRTYLLVYDRELTIPDIEPSPGEAENRQFVFALPLPFSGAPESLRVVDDLLVVMKRDEGVGLVSLADPDRPTLVRVLRDVSFEGRTERLRPSAIEVHDGRLFVSQLPGGRPSIVAFDLTRPSTPSQGYAYWNGEPRDAFGLLAGLPRMISSSGPTRLEVREWAPPSAGRALGAYDARGFRLGRAASAFALDSWTGLSVVASADVNPPASVSYLSFFDPSRPEDVTLLDVIRMDGEVQDPIHDFTGDVTLTDDGIVVGVTDTRLVLVDPQIRDLASSSPMPGEVGVPPEAPITLQFTTPVSETELGELAAFLRLREVDGSASGVEVEFSLERDAERETTVRVVPTATLRGATSYELALSPDLASRRAAGLFTHRIGFSTARATGARPELVAISPRALSVTGGTVALTVAGGVSPTFFVAGVAAPFVVSSDAGGGARTYQVDVPPSPSGAGLASLRVENESGAFTERIGALRYLEPLRLTDVTPPQGSLNGGTRVTLRGEGFRGGEMRVELGEQLVPEDDVVVLDGQTIEIVTPPGVLGVVDVTVSTTEGATATLADAYEYQEPLQSAIRGFGRIYDMKLDPTGTYLVTAAGTAGVVIYDVDASRYSDGDELDLQRLIDEDGDGRDDRIVAQVSVGGTALGVEPYFERGVDRVIVTGYRVHSTEEPPVAYQWVLAFDPLDPSSASVIDALPLPGTFARGIDAANQRSVVAMAEAGVGIVDLHLVGESYLVDELSLPSEHTALDVLRVPPVVGETERYLVAAGRFDVLQNTLRDELDPRTGGFYLVEHDVGFGMRIAASLAIPSSRIALRGHTAFLASGRNGVVVVDLSTWDSPRVVRRIEGVVAHDVDVSGHFLYVANGTGGIAVFDVSDPRAPTRVPGLESAGGDVRSVVATGYSGIGGASDTPVVTVNPDAALKIFRVDPQDGILDRDAIGRERIVVRFNKAIDLYEPNRSFFHVLAGERELPVDVAIVNNDAILDVPPGHGLMPGGRWKSASTRGVASVKPVRDGELLTLYRLGVAQRSRSSIAAPARASSSSTRSCRGASPATAKRSSRFRGRAFRSIRAAFVSTSVASKPSSSASSPRTSTSARRSSPRGCCRFRRRVSTTCRCASSTTAFGKKTRSSADCSSTRPSVSIASRLRGVPWSEAPRSRCSARASSPAPRCRKGWSCSSATYQ